MISLNKNICLIALLGIGFSYQFYSQVDSAQAVPN